ncbi:MAG TPA: hypothetical protein VGG41_11680 [Solirubrobacteraceae bacterium]|jgi:hypothetical protein
MAPGFDITKRFLPRFGPVAHVMAAALAAIGLAAVLLWAPAGARAAALPTTKVTATITNSRVALAPSYVPAGTVVITVVNRTKDRREFGEGARRTGVIAAGSSGQLTVTVAGSGEREFFSVAPAGSRHRASQSHRLTAALHLFEPCSNAAATTVDVQIDKAAGGLTLSSSAVPCGAVTFDITDVDTTSAVLLIAAEAPPVSVVTKQMNPGTTATLTVEFPATALARCSVVQIGGDGVATTVGSVSLEVG